MTPLKIKIYNLILILKMFRYLCLYSLMIISKQQKNSVFSSSSSNHEPINQVHSEPICNSSLLTEYISTMPKALLEKQQILEKLQLQGFYFNQKYSFEFISQIIKVNDCSVTYSIEFGNFQHHLHVYITRIQLHNLVTRKYLSSGNHAWTEYFKFEDSDVVAKVTKVKKINTEQELVAQNILKEVFILKLASALQISPKFINMYGYDIIRAGQKVEFLMQKCQVKAFDSSQQQKKLLEGLYSMHKVRLIHGDINSSNIMWSSKYRKHVFIDFGFSQFTQQILGQKTLSSFKGSLHFCSKQMKQAFYLRKPMPVDLYYNDLFGVLKYIQSLNIQKHDISKEEKNEVIPLKNKKKQNSKSSPKFSKAYLYSWNQLISFFKANFMAYQQKYDEMLSLLQSEQNLVQSLRIVYKKAIAEIKQEKLKQIRTKELLQIKKQTLQLQNIVQGEQTLDIYLYIQLMSHSSIIQQCYKRITFSNIESIIKLGLFSKYWLQNHHKRQIFRLIYLQNEFQQSLYSVQTIRQQKMKIINQINLISGLKTVNQLDSYYHVLCEFRKFFCIEKDLKYLQIISDIFEIFMLISQVQNTSQLVCTIFRDKDKQIGDYIMAAHNFLYRSTFYNLFGRNYWAKLYANKYLTGKQNINEMESIFLKLIDMQASNTDQLRNQIEYLDPKDSQIFKSCLQIKNLYFSDCDESEHERISQQIQSNQLYTQSIYLQYLSNSNRYFLHHNQPYKQDNFPIRYLNFSLRQIYRLKHQNPNRFFKIIQSYFNFLQKNKLVLNLNILKTINYCLSNVLKKIQNQHTQKLMKWIHKYNKSILEGEYIKNENQRLYIIESLMHTYDILQNRMIGRLGFTKENYINEHIEIQSQIIHVYLQQLKLNGCKSQEMRVIQGYKLLIQLDQTKQRCQSSKLIKYIFQFVKQHQLEKAKQFFYYLLFFIGKKYLKLQYSDDDRHFIRQNYKKIFYKEFQSQIDNKTNSLPLDLIMKVIYQKQDSQKLFKLFIQRGDQLKIKTINYSAISIAAVRYFIILDKYDLQKYKIIMGWKLSEVSSNLYRTAFSLMYLARQPLKSLNQVQARRLYVLSILGVSTVDFGHYHIEQEINVWNRIKQWQSKKRNKKMRKILCEPVRRWCRYQSIRKNITSLCKENQSQFLQSRQKLKKRKNRYTKGNKNNQDQFIECYFNKKRKKLKRNLRKNIN